MISKGRDYTYKDRWNLNHADELRFGMIKGMEYYLIGVGTDVFPGFFKVSVWIEKHQRPDKKNQITILKDWNRTHGSLYNISNFTLHSHNVTPNWPKNKTPVINIS